MISKQLSLKHLHDPVSSDVDRMIRDLQFRVPNLSFLEAKERVLSGKRTLEDWTL